MYIIQPTTENSFTWLSNTQSSCVMMLINMNIAVHVHSRQLSVECNFLVWYPMYIANYVHYQCVMVFSVISRCSLYWTSLDI